MFTIVVNKIEISQGFMQENSCERCQFCINGKSKKVKVNKEVKLQHRQLLIDNRYHQVAMVVDNNMIKYYKENSIVCAICLEILVDDRPGQFSYIKCPSNKRHAFHLECLLRPHRFFKECPLCRHNSRSESIELLLRFSLLYACQCLGEDDSKLIKKVFECRKRSWDGERIRIAFREYNFMYYELLILYKYCNRIKYRCFGAIKAEIIKEMFRRKNAHISHSKTHEELEVTNSADIHTYPTTYKITGGLVRFLSNKQILQVLEILVRSSPPRSSSTRSQIRDLLWLVLQHTECFFDYNTTAEIILIISASGDIETLDFIYRNCKTPYKFNLEVVEKILISAIIHTPDIIEYELTMLYILLTKGSLFPASEEYKMVLQVLVSVRTNASSQIGNWLNSIFMLRHRHLFGKLQLFGEITKILKTGNQACYLMLARLECSLSNIKPTQMEKIIFLFPEERIWLFSDIHQIFSCDLLPIKFYMKCIQAAASSKNVPACSSLLRIMSVKEYFTTEVFITLIDLFVQCNVTFLIYLLLLMARKRIMFQLKEACLSECIIARLELLKLYHCIPFFEGYVKNDTAYNESIEKMKEQILSFDLKTFLKNLPEEYYDVYPHLPFYYRYFSEYITKSPSFHGPTEEDFQEVLEEYMKSIMFYTFLSDDWLKSLCFTLYNLKNGELLLETLLLLAPSSKIKQMIKLTLLRMILRILNLGSVSRTPSALKLEKHKILEHLQMDPNEIENLDGSPASLLTLDKLEEELLLVVLQKLRYGIL